MTGLQHAWDGLLEAFGVSKDVTETMFVEDDLAIDLQMHAPSPTPLQ